MIALIAQALVVLAGLVVLATAVYKKYYCPKAKARRAALKDGKDAVDAGDTSRITAAFNRLRRR